MRAVLAVFVGLAGCGEPAAAPACAGGAWGEPAYDALEELNEADLFERSPEALDRFARRLEAAARVTPRLDPAARTTLQNDAWGVWQRARAQPSSSATQHAIEAAAARLVRRLAAGPVPALGPGLPAPVGTALGPGWRELESELPSLQHERLFGLRRVFHVARRGDGERALFSTLVALDPRGIPRITSVVGDLEVLRFEGARLAGARLFELDRRNLRCQGPARALREVDEARHVPGTGAHDFLARFDPPAPLRELPCAECHDDDSMMSLPAADLAVGSRFEALLAPARTEGNAVFDRPR